MHYNCFLTGEINVDYKGHKPGQGPGAGQGSNSYGVGPTGASHGGRGGRGSHCFTTSKAYGTIYEPELYGSGGGGNGGRGGGIIRFDVSDMFRLEGRLRANGERGVSGGGGSGGSVLIRTSSFDGEGSIEVNGGAGSSNAGGGAGGRIAVYHEGDNTYLGKYLLFGGTSTSEKGGAGTLYIEDCKNASKLHRTLKIDNGVYTKRSQLIGEIVELNLAGNSYSNPYYLTSYQAPNGIKLTTTGTPYCGRTSSDGRRCYSDSSYLGNIFQDSNQYYTTVAMPEITYKFPISFFLDYILIYPTCSSGYTTKYRIEVFDENDDIIVKSSDWVDTTNCLQGHLERFDVGKTAKKVRVLNILRYES